MDNSHEPWAGARLTLTYNTGEHKRTRMYFLDFNVALGRRATPAGGSFDTPEALLTTMLRLRIGAALAHHPLAADGDMELGNLRLRDMVSEYPNLLQSWVMAPAIGNEHPAPGMWVHRAVTAGVRAIHLFPNKTGFALNEPGMQPLLEEIANAELPVVLDFRDRHDCYRPVSWPRLTALCRAHTKVRFAVVGVQREEAGHLARALEACSNLFVEYHRLTNPRILTQLHAAGFGDRLLFGTGMPAQAGECVLEMTHRSGLKKDAIRAVSGANARTLLGVVEPEAISPLEVEPIVRPSGVTIDACAYLGHHNTLRQNRTNTDALFSEGHRLQVHKTFVSSFSAIYGHPGQGNRETAEAIRQYPGTFFGHAVVNPHCPEDMQTDLPACFDNHGGFVGMAFFCDAHQATMCHAGYKPALRFAQERQIPVMVHGASDRDWETFAQKYPDICFVLAGLGSHAETEETWLHLKRWLLEVPTLYGAFNSGFPRRGALESLYRDGGGKKMLYASGYPECDMAFQLGRIMHCNLRQNQRINILGGNALLVYDIGEYTNDLMT